MADRVDVRLTFKLRTLVVYAAIQAKKRKSLFGAAKSTKTTMERRMRYRKGISSPGDYPSAHKPLPLLRKFVRFQADTARGTFIVGPEKLHRGGKGIDREHVEGGKPFPRLINEGGVIVRHRAIGRGRTFRRVGNRVRMVYRPRPFTKLTLPYAAQRLASNMKKINLA